MTAEATDLSDAGNPPSAESPEPFATRFGMVGLFIISFSIVQWGGYLATIDKQLPVPLITFGTIATTGIVTFIVGVMGARTARNGNGRNGRR